MSWRDEPVKVGDQFLTEKGGVVTVTGVNVITGYFSGRAESRGVGFWTNRFQPQLADGETATGYGPIIGKINKEKTMQEWKTGPCTLTSKDGKSVLVGSVLHLGADHITFQVTGATGNNAFHTNDWTPTYPLPTLPDKVGAVIESGDGVRFMLTEHLPDPWVKPQRVSTGNGKDYAWASEKAVSDYCSTHGGFKVLLEGN